HRPLRRARGRPDPRARRPGRQSCECGAHGCGAGAGQKVGRGLTAMCPVKSPDCMPVRELCHRWSAEWPQRSPEDLEKWLMVQCRRFPELVESPDETRECPDFLWSAIAKIDLAPLREVCRKTRMRPPTFAPKQSKPGLEK